MLKVMCHICLFQALMVDVIRLEQECRINWKMIIIYSYITSP